MGETPAHGAERAHADVADEPRDRGQERTSASDLGELFQRVVTGQPTHAQPAILRAHMCEWQAGDVHHETGPGKPIVEERHQALPSGQHLGLGAVRPEQRQGFLQRVGRHVLERVLAHHDPTNLMIRATSPSSVCAIM